MSRLKIGVLTFHRCINYGSYWQARCLVESLRTAGHDAVLLDHNSKRINLAEWKCAYQPVLPIEVPAEDYPLYRKKIENFFKAFDELPLSNCFSLEQPGEMEYYDVVIIGSDEVWNLFHPWYGGNGFFYGEGIKAGLIISYAASFGNYPAVNGLPAEYAEKLFQNFNKISVRDENSKTIISNALGIESPIVLDPCLAFPIIEHLQQKVIPWQQPYVAVYGHNFSETFARNIKKWAAHRNLPLVSIGYRNEWADKQWLTAGPREFAHFISQSEAVVTNFFHGCIFSLRFQKPFACESSAYRSIKVSELMVKIGGQKHLLNSHATLNECHKLLDHSIDKNILENILRLRQQSVNYLESSVPCLHHQTA
ncbi:MAG: polysaccharide pyruvyl transferase family protein [Bacteroidota bacterium]